MWYDWNCILINSSRQFCQDLLLLCETTSYFKISEGLQAAKLDINSLAPRRSGLKRISWISIFSVAGKIFVRWMPQNSIDDKSTLVKVMNWGCQATCHYLSQYWPRSLSPYPYSIPNELKSSHRLECWHAALWYQPSSRMPNCPAIHKEL